MKRISIALVAVMIIIAASCKKDEVNPSKPNPKAKVIECKKCEAGWDLTDTMP